MANFETANNIEEQIKGIIAKQLRVSPVKVTLDASIKDDLGADSLDATELIIAIESAFRVSIPDDEAMRFLTVKDVVRYIEESLKLRSADAKGVNDG